MDTWQDRVRAEKAELDAKIEKLEEFLAKLRHNHMGLSSKQITLLAAQDVHMRLYSGILAQRLEPEED